MMLLDFHQGWIAIFICIVLVQARIEPQEGKKDAVQFTSSKKACQEVPNSKEKGDLEVVCSKVQSLSGIFAGFTSEQMSQIVTLTFTQSNFSSLSLDDLFLLPSLDTLRFNQSNVSAWKIPKNEAVPKVKSLILDDCWNNYHLISPHRNATLEFTSNMFDGLASLERLHLVHCYIVNMTTKIFGNYTNLKKVYISKESGIGCEPQMMWVLDWIDAGKAEVANDTKCFVARDLEEGGGGMLVMSTYYSLNTHPFLLIMRHRRVTEEHCPKECRCAVEGYQGYKNKPLINLYCDHAGLTSLPKEVPPHSSRLDFSYNNISDITTMLTSKNYRGASSIRLEHNHISHIDGDLIYNFFKDRSHLDLFITLNNNNITTLPVKQMLRFYKEVKVSSSYKPFFTLEFNPWDCSDCSFLPEFQELVYFQYYYREKENLFFDDIRCAKGFYEGQMVLKLDVEAQCVPDPPLLQPVDILNISLVIVLILIFAHFAYNFYQYRHHSKLPWVVTKLPCC